jgi:hypothetical protein
MLRFLPRAKARINNPYIRRTNMKNEVIVSKGLAETLKKKREEKEMREYLRRLLVLERAVYVYL